MECEGVRMGGGVKRYERGVRGGIRGGMRGGVKRYVEGVCEKG